ncbi:hypothetical protein IGJ98_001857 [Enterococcus sp. DIV0996a]
MFSLIFFEEVTSVPAIYSVLGGKELVAHLFYEKNSRILQNNAK